MAVGGFDIAPLCCAPSLAMEEMLFLIMSILQRLWWRFVGYEDADPLQTNPDEEYVTCMYARPGDEQGSAVSNSW